MAARVLDTAKPYALAGDVQTLMTLPDVAAALVMLAAPIDVLFAQKDLNVLGASPPLPEDGVLGPETQAAIAGIQSRFGQNATGALDDGTAVAIRYAVGCINAQGV
jgi:peptidoglycan hydrolase-like protein with peptidoglycan-binding domain